MKQRRFLLDSTLRDGEQSPGICFSPDQKMKIASILDYGGVHQIEAGIPAVSKQEKETIVKIIANRKNAAVSVWSRLASSDIEHAIDVHPDIIHVSIPVSQVHIHEKLRHDEEWVKSQLRDCLYLVDKNCVPLSVGFEDAFRSDTGFMTTIAKILLDYGVTRIRLADTVGVATPSRCRELVNELSEKLDGKAAFGIHAHNDFGMAVANTLEAAKSGCLYADVTAGGIGERAGNCNFTHLVQASSSLFDWGISASASRDLQYNILRVIKPTRRTR